MRTESEVYILSIKYDEVYINDEDFIKNKEFGFQFMILDIGSPRSLMGKHEYDRLRASLSGKQLKRIVERPASEKFRFGPSKIYDSTVRVEIPIMIKDIEISARFFIIDGAVPILIGNDILEPLGGVIDTEDRNIEFKKLDRSLHLVKTRGGHYVLPLQRKKKDVAQTDDDEVNEELSGENETFLDSDESDAVVLLSLAECETDQAVWRLHDVLGHRSFLTALLSNDEEKEIMKVHRYFGHRSGRKIWELFAKSGRLNDKKKAVLDLLDRCKSCKLMKKTPPRPRVGLPVANTFNEIVGLDLKIFSTGQHIL